LDLFAMNNPAVEANDFYELGRFRFTSIREMSLIVIRRHLNRVCGLAVNA